MLRREVVSSLPSPIGLFLLWSKAVPTRWYRAVEWKTPPFLPSSTTCTSDGSARQHFWVQMQLGSAHQLPILARATSTVRRPMRNARDRGGGSHKGIEERVPQHIVDVSIMPCVEKIGIAVKPLHENGSIGIMDGPSSPIREQCVEADPSHRQSEQWSAS